MYFFGAALAVRVGPPPRLAGGAGAGESTVSSSESLSKALFDFDLVSVALGFVFTTGTSSKSSSESSTTAFVFPFAFDGGFFVGAFVVFGFIEPILLGVGGLAFGAASFLKKLLRDACFFFAGFGTSSDSSSEAGLVREKTG